MFRQVGPEGIMPPGLYRFLVCFDGNSWDFGVLGLEGNGSMQLQSNSSFRIRIPRNPSQVVDQVFVNSIFFWLSPQTLDYKCPLLSPDHLFCGVIPYPEIDTGFPP